MSFPWFFTCSRGPLPGSTFSENRLIIILQSLQAYHSQIKEVRQQVGNMAILPLRTQVRGPAPSANVESDIIDESLYYFKANVFFRTYEIKVRSGFPDKPEYIINSLSFPVRCGSRAHLCDALHHRVPEEAQ